MTEWSVNKMNFMFWSGECVQPWPDIPPTIPCSVHQHSSPRWVHHFLHWLFLYLLYVEFVNKYCWIGKTQNGDKIQNWPPHFPVYLHPNLLRIWFSTMSGLIQITRSIACFIKWHQEFQNAFKNFKNIQVWKQLNM